MSNISKLVWACVLFCIVVANMVGRTMARRVEQRAGTSHWPPAANTKLAKDYRALYGADQNYLSYCFFNLAAPVGMLIWALYSVFIA
jgi:hypothetical protein